MNKKYIYKTLLMALSIIFILGGASCIGDKGNYDYAEVDDFLPSNITGLPKTYYAENHITLTPVIEGLVEGEEYEYSWSVIEQGSSPIIKKIEIANVKDLDQDIHIPNGDYMLYFTVRNVKHNIYKKAEVELKVASLSINRGWYVLKDIDGMTDFDYIKIGDESVDYQRDVLKTLAFPLDSRLKGKAVRLAYQSRDYCHEMLAADGSTAIVRGLRALHVLSSEDMKTFNPLTMVVYKSLDEEFFEKPAILNFQDLFISSVGTGHIFVINNNELYSIGGNTINVGKFGYPCSDNVRPRIAGSGGNALYFDNTSKSFRILSPGDPFPRIFAEPTDGRPSLNNMDVDLTASTCRPAGTSQLVTRLQSVLKSKNTDEHYIVNLSVMVTINSYPSTTNLSFDTIPETMQVEMPTASLFASPKDGRFIYFAKDNKVGVHYNPKNIIPKEVTLVTLDAGETISHIEYMDMGATHLLLVLSNSSSGWKMRHYKIANIGQPSIETIPEAVFEGQGAARHAIYRAS